MKSGTKRPSAVSGSLAGRQDDCQDVRPSVVKTSSGGEPDQSDMQPQTELRTKMGMPDFLKQISQISRQGWVSDGHKGQFELLTRLLLLCLSYIKLNMWWKHKVVLLLCRNHFGCSQRLA